MGKDKKEFLEKFECVVLSLIFCCDFRHEENDKQRCIATIGGAVTMCKYVQIQWRQTIHPCRNLEL